MLPSQLIELGILLAEGVAKVIQAIVTSKDMSDADKAAAIASIKVRLQVKDAKVQSTSL
jgi:hypothetical protein